MDSDVPFHKVAPSDKDPVLLRPSPGFRKDSPRPERQKPDITGRWESVVDDLRNPPALSWILLINQSSTWIEGRLVEVLDARTRRARAVQGICGQALSSGDELALSANKQGEPGDGTVDVDGRSLIVTWVGKGCDFVQQRFVLMPDGQRPSFFGLAIDDVMKGKGPIDSETKTVMTRAETLPLHSWQVRKLQRILDPAIVHGLLVQAYPADVLATHHDQLVWRQTTATRIQALIHGAVTTLASSDWRILRRLDDAKLYDTVTTESPGFWHSGDKPLVKALARTILGLNRSEINGNTRSQLQWIENLAAAVRTQEYARDPLSQLAVDLDIRNGLGAQAGGPGEHASLDDEYTYDLELELHPPSKDQDPIVEQVAKGVSKIAKKLLDKLPTGMKLGGSLGELKVHRKGKHSRDRNWIETYKVFAGGFGFALESGGQADVSGKASFTTAEEWTKRDFVGSFKILDGGVWFAPRPSDIAKLKPKGKDKEDWSQIDDEVEEAIDSLPSGARKALRAGLRDVNLEITGAGNHVVQSIPFEAAKKVGSGVGGSAFFSFGWIRMPEDLVTVDDTRPLGVREMRIAAAGKAQAHFDLGSAILTEEGRLALRRLCASELPWFRRDDTQIVFTAHCDLVRFRRNSTALAPPAPLGLGDQAKTDDPRNMQLAVYRAANVKQAIKDILGDRLKTPGKLLVENPMGKKEAEEAKSRGYEPYRNPHRRRVDVTMNGRHVLTLTEA
jgi:hypothetical protein